MDTFGKRLIYLCTRTSEHSLCVCVPRRAQTGIETLLPFLKIHNCIEKSNIKNYSGLVAAVDASAGCIKPLRLATRNTETGTCVIYDLYILKLNPPASWNNTRNNTTDTFIVC